MEALYENQGGVGCFSALKEEKKINVGAGISAMVSFKYEKLRAFCFLCGKIDHTESRCDKLFDSIDGVVEKGCGPELKAPDRYGKSMAGDKWLKQESFTSNFKNVEDVGCSRTSEEEISNVNNYKYKSLVCTMNFKLATVNRGMESKDNNTALNINHTPDHHRDNEGDSNE